jgi:hypothetical protein
MATSIFDSAVQTTPEEQPCRSLIGPQVRFEDGLPQQCLSDAQRMPWTYRFATPNGSRSQRVRNTDELLLKPPGRFARVLYHSSRKFAHCLRLIPWPKRSYNYNDLNCNTPGAIQRRRIMSFQEVMLGQPRLTNVGTVQSIAAPPGILPFATNGSFGTRGEITCVNI